MDRPRLQAARNTRLDSLRHNIAGFTRTPAASTADLSPVAVHHPPCLTQSPSSALLPPPQQTYCKTPGNRRQRRAPRRYPATLVGMPPYRPPWPPPYHVLFSDGHHGLEAGPRSSLQRPVSFLPRPLLRRPPLVSKQDPATASNGLSSTLVPTATRSNLLPPSQNCHQFPCTNRRLLRRLRTTFSNRHRNRHAATHSAPVTTTLPAPIDFSLQSNRTDTSTTMVPFQSAAPVATARLPKAKQSRPAVHTLYTTQRSALTPSSSADKRCAASETTRSAAPRPRATTSLNHINRPTYDLTGDRRMNTTSCKNKSMISSNAASSGRVPVRTHSP